MLGRAGAGGQTTTCRNVQESQGHDAEPTMRAEPNNYGIITGHGVPTSTSLTTGASARLNVQE